MSYFCQNPHQLNLKKPNMNKKKTNKETLPLDITWALVLFLACIMYAVLFHGNNSASLLSGGLG